MMRVLLCTEHQADVAITSGFLRHVSPRYQVDWARSYGDALARTEAGGHQVLIVDAELGMGRGLELLHHQLQRGRPTPVVLLLREANASFEAAALRAGAADVLVRDAIDPGSLERAVRHADMRARMAAPHGWRPGASLITPIEASVDLAEVAVLRARRERLGCAVLAISYDMPVSARQAAERMGAAFFASLLERLQPGLSDGDIARRVGDHEFLVIAHSLSSARLAAELAGKILLALSEPLTVGGEQVRLAAQLGVANFPDDAADGQTLVAHAREAMHAARAGTRSQLRMHQGSKAARVDRRAEIRRLALGAIERGELSLAYQPQINVDTGEVVGAEALLRWTSPELGAVSPAELIPIVEELGLIGAYGEWALREACHQASRWARERAPLCVGVNVSAAQFGGDFYALVEDALRESGLPAHLLELEITEGLLLENTSSTRGVLERLRADGILIAVDDFGTGYASLSYVKRFPMDVIKIDREFVRGLPLDSENVAISNAIVALARSLSLGVIAEGVETEAEEEFLRSLGCPVIQGYLHARPMPPEAFELWRAERERGAGAR